MFLTSLRLAKEETIMKKSFLLIPILIFITLSLSACGSSVERTLDSGNKAFGEGAYEQAIETYSRVMEMAPTLAEPVYNLANTLYRLEAFEQTGPLMDQALQLASEELAQNGFYNQGNNYFQQQQMDNAIENYQESLRLNPDDLDAKYNLELAMQQQEQQQQEQEQQQEQQQQEQNQSGEDQQEQESDQQQDQNQSEEDQQQGDQENEDQQDQNGQQDPQDQNQDGEEGQKDQDQSGDQQQESDPQDQGQNDQGSPEEQEQNAQSQPQQLEGLTEEQARQILGAIGQSTETLQEKLQEIFGVPIAPSGKDW